LFYFNWLIGYAGRGRCSGQVPFLPCGKICRSRLQKGGA
jgi:hypothetical protein